MSEERTPKSVRVLCDEARKAAAEQLAGIVTVFAAKATAAEASVPHAKFLVELLQMELPQTVERKKKTADETTEEQKPEEPSLSKVLLDTLQEMMVESGREPNATALP